MKILKEILIKILVFVMWVFWCYFVVNFLNDCIDKFKIIMEREKRLEELNSLFCVEAPQTEEAVEKFNIFLKKYNISSQIFSGKVYNYYTIFLIENLTIVHEYTEHSRIVSVLDTVPKVKYMTDYFCHRPLNATNNAPAELLYFDLIGSPYYENIMLERRETNMTAFPPVRITAFTKNKFLQDGAICRLKGEHHPFLKYEDYIFELKWFDRERKLIRLTPLHSSDKRVEKYKLINNEN